MRGFLPARLRAPSAPRRIRGVQHVSSLDLPRPRLTLLVLVCASLAACAPDDAAPSEGESRQASPPGVTEERVVQPPDGISLHTRRERPVPGKPEWMCAADVDGRGGPDVIAATHSPGALLLWRGEARAPETVEVGDYPLRPLVLSGEDSGASRIAVASRADSSLVILDLSKSGAPNEVLRVDLPEIPMTLAAGELNSGREEILVLGKNGQLSRIALDGERQDSQLDSSAPRCALVLQGGGGFVVGFQSSDSLEFFDENEGGLIEAVGSQALSGVPRDLLELDVDGDGDLELLAVGGDYGGWIFGANGAALFGDGAEPIVFKTTAIPARILPVPGDGVRWSVMAMSSVACELWEWRAGKPKRALFSYAGQTPADMTLRDATGDGIEDFWVANRDAHRISVLRFDGTAPVHPLKIHVGSFPNDMAHGDLDGDGLDELFVINAKHNSISVLRNGAGGFKLAFVLPTGPSPRAILSADIDVDGHADILWLDRNAAGTRLVIRSGDGSGTLKTPTGFQPLVLGIGSRDLVAEVFAGFESTLVVAADPEGRRILWTTVDSSANGELSFSAPAELSLRAPPRSIATVKQNGKPRGLAVAMQLEPARSLIEVYVPAGDAGAITWRKLGECELSGAIVDLEAGDLDADGTDDLVALCADREGAVGGKVIPMRLRGGKPEPLAAMATDLRPQRVLASDLNGDGRAEILVANLDSHNVNLWMTTAEGKRPIFQRLDDVGAGVGCIALCASDLDGDGNLDLAVVDSANDGVSVIFNEAR